MSEVEGMWLYLFVLMDIDVGGSYDVLWDEMWIFGFVCVRIDGMMYEID